jgi:hypothetical protein
LLLGSVLHSAKPYEPLVVVEEVLDCGLWLLLVAPQAVKSGAISKKVAILNMLLMSHLKSNDDARGSFYAKKIDD